MKTKWDNKFLFFLLLMGSMCFTSCRDENVDLDNVSEKIVVGGKLHGPLVKESTISLDSLLQKYESDVPDLKIDSAANGDIILTYEKNIDYEMPEINDGFGTFNQNMGSFSLSDIFQGSSLDNILANYNFGVSLPAGGSPYIAEYRFSCGIEDGWGGDLQDKQKISRIVLENGTLNVNITPDFNIAGNNFLKIELLNSKNVTLCSGNVTGNNTFTTNVPNPTSNTIELTDTLIARFTINGDNTTIINSKSTINLGLSLTQDGNNNFKYIVFGLFDYSYFGAKSIKLQEEHYLANIRKYIPEGSQLNLLKPKFEFTAESNIGADLKFSLTELKAFLDGNTSSDLSDLKPTKDGDFIVKRATLPGDIASTASSDTWPPVNGYGFRIIDSDYFKDNGKDVSNFLTSRLDSLYVSYGLSTRTTDVKNKVITPSNEEFIPSNGVLTIHGKVTSPLSFNESSVLCYADTFDIDFSGDYFDEASLISLHITCKNHCPIGFFVDFYLLDENDDPIPTDPKNKENFVYRSLDIPRGKVDGNGRVEKGPAGEVPSEFDLEFKSDAPSSIKYLKSAKRIALKYQSKRGTNPLSAPIRITKDDYLKVSIGFLVDGKILLDSDNK